MCEICPVTASRFVAFILSPIITIFSIIAFIYMAKFKGWLITISALFLLIFGTIINFELFVFLLTHELFVSLLGHAFIILKGIFIFICNLLGIELIKAAGIGSIVITSAFIIPFICVFSLLYGILGYACKKWRIKNNIPLNSVYEKDTIIIAIVFLVGSIISIGPILYRIYFG